MDYLPGFCGVGFKTTAALEAVIGGLEGEVAHRFDC